MTILCMCVDKTCGPSSPFSPLFLLFSFYIPATSSVKTKRVHRDKTYVSVFTPMHHATVLPIIFLCTHGMEGPFASYLCEIYTVGATL